MTNAAAIQQPILLCTQILVLRDQIREQHGCTLRTATTEAVRILQGQRSC